MADAVGVTDADLDGMSDEDFAASMDDSETVMAGSEESGEAVNEDTSDSEDTDSDVSDTEEDAEEETNDQTDGDDQDSSDADEDEELDETEENAHSDEDEATDGEDEEEDEEDTADDAGSEEDSETEDEDETTDQDDGADSDTDGIDYQAEYAELKAFHDAVTSEFKANGQMIPGINDPAKIKLGLQMGAGVSEKMKALKPYKQFMTPLKDRGFLDNPEKFDLAMQLLDGDVDAIKKHMKDLEIDPFELDMDKVDYKPKRSTASNMDIAVDDLFENARSHGVEKQIQGALEKDWDQDSVVEILQNPRMSEDLVDHMESGAYEAVQTRIATKKIGDAAYGRMSSIKQYQEAAAELKGEYEQYVADNKPEAKRAPAAKKGSAEPAPKAVKAETAKIEKKRKAEAYKKKVAEREAKVETDRKKAASVSGKKRGTRKKVAAFDPDKLSDEDFASWADSFA